MPYRETGADCCELCTTTVEEGAAQQHCGHVLCPACLAGSVGDRLADRALRIQQLRRVYIGPGAGVGDRSNFVSQIHGAVPVALDLRATFSREDVLTRVGKLFRRELQVGDPLFDDRVHIRTDNPDLLGQLLRGNERLQSLIRGVVEQADSLEIRGNRLRVTLRKQVSEAGLRRDAALVLHHLAGLAERTGAAETPVGPLFEPAELHEHDYLTEVAIHGDRVDLEWLVEQLLGCRECALAVLSLEHLRLQTGDLSPLSRFAHLTYLRLNAVPEVVQVASLAAPQLEALTLRHTGVSDVTPLADLAALRRLSLNWSPVHDLSPVRRMQRLEELYLRATGVHDLSPLAGMTRIRELNLRATPITTIAPLSGLTGLEMLNIRDTAVDDLTPAMKLPLKRLFLEGSRVPAEQVQAIKRALPDLELDPH